MPTLEVVISCVEASGEAVTEEGVVAVPGGGVSRFEDRVPPTGAEVPGKVTSDVVEDNGAMGGEGDPEVAGENDVEEDVDVVDVEIADEDEVDEVDVEVDVEEEVDVVDVVAADEDEVDEVEVEVDVEEEVDVVDVVAADEEEADAAAVEADDEDEVGAVAVEVDDVDELDIEVEVEDGIVAVVDSNVEVTVDGRAPVDVDVAVAEVPVCVPVPTACVLSVCTVPVLPSPEKPAIINEMVSMMPLTTEEVPLGEGEEGCDVSGTAVKLSKVMSWSEADSACAAVGLTSGGRTFVTEFGLVSV